MVTWEVVKLGARFPGRCAVCRSFIEGRHLAEALLLGRRLLGKVVYGVAHAACCDVRLKHKIGGRVTNYAPLPDTIEGEE